MEVQQFESPQDSGQHNERITLEALLNMPGQDSIKSHAEPIDDRANSATSGNTKLGCPSSVEKQAHKKHKGGPSAAEVLLIKKYLQTTRPLEEGVDEEALGNLVNSSTFKKFVHRSELEDEVSVLNKQLQHEVELHASLKRALADASGALPNVPRHLPSSAQKLVSDIATLEGAVLELETQTTALEWELVHERTEREVIEHCLNQPLATSLQPCIDQLFPASAKNTTPESQIHPPETQSPLTTAPVTLKELLRSPCPQMQEIEQQASTSPKSPKRSLRSLWGAHDSLSRSPPQSSSGQPSFRKGRRSASPLRLATAGLPEREQLSPSLKQQAKSKSFPSPIQVKQNNLSISSSPFTPEEHPRPTSPVTPDKIGWSIRTNSTELQLKDLPNLLPSSKRLSFWNFSSDDDNSSQSGCVLTNFAYVDQKTSQYEESPSVDEKRSLYRTGIMRMRELRSRGFRESSTTSTTSTSTSSSNSDNSENLRERSSRAPFLSRPESESGYTWMKPPEDPNKLSEEMVRCMVNIYSNLADSGDEQRQPHSGLLSPSSHFGNLTSSSLSSLSESSLLSFARSPLVDLRTREDVMGCDASPDPYKARGKLPWADIGPYSNFLEVPWLSVGKKELEYAAHALCTYRLLVEQLAKVDPSTMTHNQKLAFWINVYNALLMHAFLAYGIPRSDLKFFTLIQKAAYCVGGHWFNAAVIEFCLLKGKAMAYRPQFALMMALQKNKVTEEQSNYGIDRVEPKVHFALSCGARSSPMVRIYTAEDVQEELDVAFQDYARASVGISAKGKLLVPKLLYSFTRDIVEDSALLDTVCNLLPTSQVAVILDCVQQRRRRLLNTRNFAVVPFDFTFRYLFPGNAGEKLFN